MLKPDYIIGLTDGEDSFTVYIRNPDLEKNIKRQVKAEPRFYLKLNEKDKDILYKLKDFFNCGNIYFQKDKRRNHRDCYRFEATSRDDLINVIVPFFRNHKLKLSSKKKDFKIFCEILERIKKKEHLTNSGLKSLYLLKQKMH